MVLAYQSLCAIFIYINDTHVTAYDITMKMNIQNFTYCEMKSAFKQNLQAYKVGLGQIKLLGFKYFFQI